MGVGIAKLISKPELVELLVNKEWNTICVDLGTYIVTWIGGRLIDQA